MIQRSEIVRRLGRCLAVYDRVHPPLVGDPARQVLAKLLHDVAASVATIELLKMTRGDRR